MKRNSNRFLALVIGLVAPILILVTRLSWQSITPGTLPTHWRAGGAVDGTTSAGAYFVWTLALSLVAVLIGAAVSYLSSAPAAGRLFLAILTGSAWMLAAIYVLSMTLSRHATDPESVHLPWWDVLLTIGVPVAVGAGIWFLLPVASTPGQQLPRSTMHLGAAERVTWIAHAHSRALRMTAAVIAVIALVLVFVSAPAAIIAFLVAMSIGGTSELTVRVDSSGLHTLWGPLGWPRSVIRLDVITQARAQQINPMQWGGWGFRVTRRGTAANIRSGPGIVVQRTSGSSYVVTVDDAAEGADVLNALLVRNGGGQ